MTEFKIVLLLIITLTIVPYLLGYFFGAGFKHSGFRLTTKIDVINKGCVRSYIENPLDRV